MSIDEFYRAPKRTPYDPAALAEAFALAWVEHTDGPAARNGVEMLVRQALHEAPPDRCWNLTILGQKRQDGCPWVPLGTHEILPLAEALRLIAAGKATEPKMKLAEPAGTKNVYLVGSPDTPATHFRCFDDLRDAAWWSSRRYLVEGQRYATPGVRAALEVGAPTAFAFEIKAKGYMTATAAEYAKALDGRGPTAKAACAAVDWSALPVMSQRRARELAEQGDLALWGSVRASQQGSLADTLAEVERSRAERNEGGGGNV